MVCMSASVTAVFRCCRKASSAPEIAARVISSFAWLNCPALRGESLGNIHGSTSSQPPRFMPQRNPGFVDAE